jgi:hypothetical protein
MTANLLILMVRLGGLEPPTKSLGIRFRYVKQ